MSHGKTMTVTGVRPPGRFGELTIERDQIIGFNEKPQTSSGRISGGFFVCNKSVFSHLDGDTCIFEQDVLPTLSKSGMLGAYIHEGFWQCMDSLRDKIFLESLIQSDNAPWMK